MGIRLPGTPTSCTSGGFLPWFCSRGVKLGPGEDSWLGEVEDGGGNSLENEFRKRICRHLQKGIIGIGKSWKIHGLFEDFCSTFLTWRLTKSPSLSCFWFCFSPSDANLSVGSYCRFNHPLLSEFSRRRNRPSWKIIEVHWIEIICMKNLPSSYFT